VLDYLIPRSIEVNEGEDGTMIVWRKHLLLLFFYIFLPVLAFIISSYLFLASFVTALPPFTFEVHWSIRLILGFVTMASLFWYFWRYDDWRKDVYIVTDTRIIDIEASSFKLTTTRREGTFDNIQAVYSNVPNIFYKVINMGDVIIETAGTQDTFTFNSVFDPDSVTSEVFNRWALYQQKSGKRIVMQLPAR
jgi:hypothetical protein